MTDKQLLKTSSGNKLSEQIARYTLLFLITAVCVYVLFIVAPRTFLTNADGNVDGIAQQYPIYSEIKRNIHGLLTGQGWSNWSWDIGLGDDSFMEFNTKLFNPLTYIVIAFPQKYLDIGFTLMVLISQYLSGLFFLIFANKVGLERYQSLLGSICYAFSGWVLYAISRQGTFLMATMLLPLLILGTEKLFRKESPLLFMIAVAMHIIYSIQWAYVGGITILIYYFVRYFCAYNDEEHILWQDFLRFCGCGIIGIMLSGIILMENVLKMLGTTTASTVDNPILYTLSSYLEIPTGFFLMTTTTEAYTVIGLPILCVILLPLVARNVRRKSTAAIMTVGLFALSLIPITGSIFNGMSYTVGRWYYVMAFFMVWASLEAFSRDAVADKRSIKEMLIWLSALAAWGLVICYPVLDIINSSKALAIACGAILGYALLWLLTKGDIDNRRTQICVTAIVVISIAGYFNINMFPGIGDKIHDLCRVGKIESELATSTQRVGPMIQADDDSFFRIDQVDGYTDARIARVRANENMYWGNRSIYTYLSTMDSGWHEFSKIVGNNAGYFDRTTVYSNDNREGLDFLMGVKYFLGDSEDKKAGANEYAPHGYSYDRTIDGVQVLKNSYCMGLGTIYDKYISMSELMAYTPLEREQVMLQAAVVSDKDASAIEGVHHATADEIKTDVRKETVDLTAVKNIEISGDANGGKFTVSGRKNSGDFTITLPEISKARVVIALEGLVREPLDYKAELELEGREAAKNPFATAVKSLSYEDNEKFKIELTHGNIVKAAQMRKGKNQGYSDVTDYYINLGYFDNISGDINVNIDRVGEYSYDSISAYVVPMDIYEESAANLQSSKLDVKSYGGDTVTADLTAEKESIMYCSILNQQGWDIYVDGNKVDKLADGVNVTFTGAKIGEGQHSIELRYHSPGLTAGLIMMVTGVVIAALVVIRTRNKLK